MTFWRWSKQRGQHNKPMEMIASRYRSRQHFIEPLNIMSMRKLNAMTRWAFLAMVLLTVVMGPAAFPAVVLVSLRSLGVGDPFRLCFQVMVFASCAHLLIDAVYLRPTIPWPRWLLIPMAIPTAAYVGVLGVVAFFTLAPYAQCSGIRVFNKEVSARACEHRSNALMVGIYSLVLVAYFVALFVRKAITKQGSGALRRPPLPT